MKNEKKMLGYVSIILLVFVLMGQGSWLYQYREIKIEEYKMSASSLLIDVIQQYLTEKLLEPQSYFTCGVLEDGQTFVWGDNKNITLSSLKKYHDMARLVLYDHLYLNNYLNIEKIRSSYQEALVLKDIDLDFVLIIRDSIGNLVASSAVGANLSEYPLVTTPISVGYEYPHLITAAFREPSIYKVMMWYWVGEFLFVLAYSCCLYWQWHAMRLTLKNAKVQIMGVAHLEHELRKPLAIMNAALQSLSDKKREEWTDSDFLKIKLIKVRMLKIMEITETMLVAVRDATLTIERSSVDLYAEMELIREMFSVLKPNAQVDIKIQEGLREAFLDPVYFNILLMNLIDNAIKYGGETPIVIVDFSKKDGNFVLSVSDSGIGMSPSMIKHIFKQFYRGNEEGKDSISGFGLGLTFVDKVVRTYGANITVNSVLGRGSRFTITFKDVQ